MTHFGLKIFFLSKEIKASLHIPRDFHNLGSDFLSGELKVKDLSQQTA